MSKKARELLRRLAELDREAFAAWCWRLYLDVRRLENQKK